MKQGRDIEASDIYAKFSSSCRLLVLIFPPVQPLRSFLRRAKADSKGLSCMLFPFFPLRPQRLARLSSSPTAPVGILPACTNLVRAVVEVLSFCLGSRLISFPVAIEGPPPRMAETDECAHRACFLIAEVTVIHSVVIRATGSTAIDIFVSPIADICVCKKFSCAIVLPGMALKVGLDWPALGRVPPGGSSCRDLIAPPCISVSPVMLASSTQWCSSATPPRSQFGAAHPVVGKLYKASAPGLSIDISDLII